MGVADEKASASTPPGDSSPTPRPFYRRWWDSLGNAIDGRFGAVTDAAADAVHSTSDEGNINRNYVKHGMPWLMGGLGGFAGLVMLDPITRGAQRIAGHISDVARKVPLVGAPVGWVIDRIGDVTGVLFAGAAALVTFKAFLPTVANYQDFTPGPTINTPNDGTGAAAQPSVTQDMRVQRPGQSQADTVQNVPVAPRPVEKPVIEEAAMPLVEQEDATKMSYAQLREARRKALEGEHKHLQDAYRALMQAENQTFENRVQFVKDARAFTTGGARQAMVDALYLRAGIARSEAEGLVVKAPELRATVYPGADETKDHKGGDGISADGNLPATLVDFAHKFENRYGKGFILVASPDGSSVMEPVRVDSKERDKKGTPKKMGIYFDEMSTTQKTEYIEKAIHFCNARYQFIERTCGYEYDSNGPALDGVAVPAARTRRYDYTDRHWSTREDAGPIAPLIRLFSKTPVAQGQQFPSGWISWEDEHAFLQERNGDTQSNGRILIAYGFGGSREGKESGTGLQAMKSGFDGYQQILDAYKENLKQAETAHTGEIKMYKDRVHLMESSLSMLEKHGVALLSVGKQAGKDVMELRDVRAFDPAKQNTDDTRLLRLYGTRQGSRFTVDAVDAGQGKIDLGEKIAFCVDSGSGVEKTMAVIDSKIASYALAAQASGSVRLQANNVTGAPAMPGSSPTVAAPENKTEPQAAQPGGL